MHKIRDPHISELTYISEDIEKIFQGHYKELYTQPASVDEEEMKTFLNSLELPSIGYLQNYILMANITMEELKD